MPSSSTDNLNYFAVARTRRQTLILALAAACVSVAGCAAVTNPVANGVPVRLLPDELLAPSREGYETIPLTMLRQPPVENYILQAGDTLGIFIEGILGEAETVPPVNVPDSNELPPSIGYPFPIRQDGTVSLPYVDPIKVAGMTVEQAEKAVGDAYLEKQILRPQERRILVSLLRPRYIRVLVLRDDSQQRQVSLQTESLLGLGTSRTQIGGGSQSNGLVLELPAYQNDVLNALTRSGGLPGLESTQEVIIERGVWDSKTDPTGSSCYGMNGQMAEQLGDSQRTIRIPMRHREGEPVHINPQDVILKNSDIVIVRARLPEFYYMGGLLPADEVPLPDYDIHVLEAVLKGRGPVLNGGVNNSNLNGNLVATGLGSPSPSLLTVLRRTPGGGQLTIKVDLNQAMRDPRENLLVQSGDVLLLQETPNEAMTRYFSQTFQTNFFFRWLDNSDAQGTGSLVAP